MSLDWYQDILDFTDSVIQDRMREGKNYPHIPSIKIKKLKIELIKEECRRELIKALKENDIEKIADGAVDSIVVILGMCVSYGIDIRPLWDEIHKTNMAKAGGPIREDGKRLKPEGWQPPKINELLEEQMKNKED
jgi:predicted HAD superfamily Cof-like phosphohydrolase